MCAGLRENVPWRMFYEPTCINNPVNCDQVRRVDALSPTEMKETPIGVVEENQGYLFAILGSSNKEPQQPEGPGPSQSQPSWCVCNFCKEMPTQRERLCCQNDPESCISRLPDFRVLMLDEAVLAVARLYRQDILAWMQ
ncbi:uncharacterized protein LOC128174778 [Crassostrea angulata]|uniref:uncharacterized protein LOC128174778 n=1 Tax=Magallana angulata TaxID=2784310 RepID=UPI0022B153B1|nr:uncharacterized protein LOC128174778 [Crassostrea angulata]